MPNHAGALQGRFFPAKLETEGDGSIFNTLLADSDYISFAGGRRRSLLQKARFAGDFLQREAKAEGAGGHFWHDEVLTQTP